MKSLKEALIKKHTVYTTKNPFGLTKDDLIGHIKDIPMGVVVRMLEEQEGQVNKSNINVFQKDRRYGKASGGFEWDETEVGAEFWKDVLLHGNYDLFFKKYPEYKMYNL